MNSKYNGCSGDSSDCEGPVVIYLRYRYNNYNTTREIVKYYCEFHHDVAARNINGSGGDFRMIEHKPI